MAREPKLGLALSGGGFRASLFHIGVLARLADCDLLRKIEVISTVSGGSIVGAYYYLKLKRLLESKADREITRADYQQLVREMLDEFLAAVQKNVRLLTFVNPVKNLRFRRPDYSRTDRLGELLDELFYRPLMGPRSTPVQMRELIIQPKGESPGFHPERHNGRRLAKVPVLLINATTLNTGRNWRFEATRMGEPPVDDPIRRELDKRMRLPRPRSYCRLTPDQQDIELGHAVAASAAVPGLFYPLSISRLYEGVRIQLVDGGVHDNQGVQGLLDRGCDYLIISDGSGQMDGERNPGTSILSVLPRANAILMSRVREEQLEAVLAGIEDREACLVHLRKGLEPESVAYYDHARRVIGAGAPRSTTLAGQKTAPEVQWALSRIRTDLDAFNDAEAYSLMCNGYFITASQLPQAEGIWRARGEVAVADWPFFAVAPLLERPTEEYLRLLRIASFNVFKIFSLYPSLAAGCAGGLTALALWLLWIYRDALQRPVIDPASVPTWGEAAGWVFGAVLLAFFGRWWVARSAEQLGRVAVALRRPGLWLYRVAVRVILPVLAAAPLLFYLKWLNPLYLRAGEIHRLIDKGQAQPVRAVMHGVPSSGPAR